MDKLFWFGWLFKGRMDVSFFDRLMFVVDLLILLVAVVVLAVVVEGCIWLWKQIKRLFSDFK